MVAPASQAVWSRARASLPARVAALTALAVGLAVAVVAGAGYLTVRSQTLHSLDASLLQRAGAAAHSIPLREMAQARVPSWALGAADVRIAFLFPDRPPISADRGPALVLGRPELAVATGERAASLRTVTARDGHTRYRVAAVPAGVGRALVIAQSLDPFDMALDRLSTVLAIVGLLGVAVACLAGWAVARAGLRPVHRLTRAVEHVARTQELHPIPVAGHDDVARLAVAFNHTLHSLAESRDRQRRLVADAGHELRTPLTSLRTNIELLMQADARGGLSASSRAELLDDVRAQIAELTALVNDVTELAREDHCPRQEVVDLVGVVERAAARARRRALTQSIELDLQPWWVYGERVALERAVTNLLDNAVKWNPVDGTVRVSLRAGVLTVDDQGPGIAEADLPHVFDRFYRSAEARDMPGSGLGLSIVAQVAQRHDGSVRAARNDAGGARVLLHLPGSPQEPDLVAGAAGHDQA